MSRSSISSSDRSAAGAQGRAGGDAALIQFRPRLFSATVFAVIVTLAIVEALLRIGAVQDALPIRTHLHEPGAVVRLQTLQRLLASRDRVDVLFVGSSIVRCNIQPLRFDALVADRTDREIVSFNAGMSGLWPAAVRLYLEDLWLPAARPRVVVQGIRYGELFPSPRARKYDQISSGAVESAWEQPGPVARLKAAAFERMHLLQYRGTLPAWLLRYQNGRPGEIEDDEVRIFTDPRGWTPRTPTLDVVLARKLLVNERPYPALTDPRQCREAFDAIVRSCEATRKAGADYVLLNVPEHAFRWDGPDGRARYATYLAALQQLAREHNFTFVDVTGGDPRAFSSLAEYSDYHHMSPAGAERFTTLIASYFRGHPLELPNRPAALRASLP